MYFLPFSVEFSNALCIIREVRTDIDPTEAYITPVLYDQPQQQGKEHERHTRMKPAEPKADIDKAVPGKEKYTDSQYCNRPKLFYFNFLAVFFSQQDQPFRLGRAYFRTTLLVPDVLDIVKCCHNFTQLANDFLIRCILTRSVSSEMPTTPTISGYSTPSNTSKMISL